MNFVEANFILFLAIVLVLYGLVPKSNLKKAVIFISGYVFYGIWNWKYIPLLLGASLVDYFCAIKISQSNKNKENYLFLSIFFNLSLLFVFKYYDFFMSQVFSGHQYLRLVIPVGISFYTFQSMSYIVDVYRSPENVERKIFNYLLFTSFFPQLVAGPIERASHLLPQLQRFEDLNFTNVREGLQLILFGVFKKIVLADKLAVIVDKYYAHVNFYKGTDAWSAVFLYSFQIYFDFSSYTDIARGVAKMFNITLVENFNLPYLATSLTEFWKKWHMSLTNWFRDFVFYPMAFNQIISLHFSLITMLVFLLSGLWHGASWNFVVWGGLNGVILVLESNLLVYQSNLLKNKLFKSLFVLLNFIIVSVLWIFFRSPDMPTSFDVLRGLFNASTDELLTRSDVRLLCLIPLAELMTYFHLKNTNFLNTQPIYFRWFVYIVLILLIVFVGDFQGRPYIYFQF